MMIADGFSQRGISWLFQFTEMQIMVDFNVISSSRKLFIYWDICHLYKLDILDYFEMFLSPTLYIFEQIKWNIFSNSSIPWPEIAGVV